MIHLRSGDDIAPRLRSTEIGGEFARYGDPFSNGPLPADAALRRSLRLAWLMDAFQKSEQEMSAYMAEQELALAKARRDDYVVLWVESDPYDQLLLVYWLAELGGEGKTISIVQAGIDRDRKGRLAPVKLAALKARELAAIYETRQVASAEAIAVAREVWAAITAPQPTAWSGLLQPAATARLAVLPHLQPVLKRLAQEFPWMRDGLGLTERRLVQGVAGGIAQPVKLADTVQAQDPVPWLAPPLLFATVRQLVQAPVPLLTGAVNMLMPTSLRLKPTERAASALAGETPVTAAERGPRWIGGTLLQEGSPAWQWDDAAGAVVPAL